MTVEEGSTRRRTKIFVLLIVICFAFTGYYLYTYSQENTNLRKKQTRLSIQLRKYGAAFAKCDNNLKTSHGNALTFSQSNKQLQAKVKKQEKDIASLDKNNGETSSKLDQAYQFFLDLKEIIRNDLSISEDKQITREAATDLKDEVKKLKSDHADFEMLKGSHEETTKTLNELKKSHNDLMSRTNELETYSKKLFKNNKMLKRNLAEKNAALDLRSKEAVQLGDTVKQLEKRYSRIRGGTPASGAPPLKLERVEPQKPEKKPISEGTKIPQSEKTQEGTGNSSSDRKIEMEVHAVKNKATNLITDADAAPVS